MKKRLCFLLSTIGFLSAQAQTASDALRYSYIPQYGGTARAIGVGGAMGALGGDFSSISTNPAGLATYRRGEFVFTPSLHSANATSVLTDGGSAAATQSYTNFSLDNVGLVFTTQPQNARWKTVNFAIGYNRFQDFGSNVYYEGTTRGSITARFRDQANLQGLDKFESGLADEADAIYTKTVNGVKAYTTDFDLNPSAGIAKNEYIETRGGASELVLSMAGNYDDKLQIGATLGVPFIRYSESKVYKESDPLNQVKYFENLQFNQDFTTTGVGINLKIGAIFRPVSFLRIGVALHSPTAYALNDKYNNSLTYAYTDSIFVKKTATSPDGEFSYSLTTPWRAIGSLGFIFGKSGFLSADVEWADYAKSSFSYSKENIDAQNSVNTAITARYKPALSLRVGGEYALDIFRFRAGVGFNGSPRTDKDFYNTTYSAGVGIRSNSFFIDLGWQKRTTKENYTPYQVVESQANTQQKVTNDYSFNDYLLTFGFKF